ncbi:hypothetical protein [Cohnella terricola]|uniref:Hydrolase n=1 Tax=Cohnella terricola TaxID=1289167 RepID=A0A559JBP6_9BACL|nr:hypothetical protein [Cohnella terricola]TVX97306.1 hypothetical protein FPZ45_18370 [Cohnella terricola]
MSDQDTADSARKTYYVAVGPGQILEDPEAAPFEFAIRATEAEINKLEELFQEAQDADEDEIFNYEGSPFVADTPDNATYEGLLRDIYRMLHDLGTPETRSHIESMNIL